MEIKERNEKLYQYLGSIDRPFTLEDLFNKTGIIKNRHNESDLQQVLLFFDEFVEKEKMFYPKNTFLENIPFRISPSVYEIKNGILIPGHRFLPFQPTGTPVDYVSLSDNGVAIKTKKICLKKQQIASYFSLMDWQKLPILNIDDLFEEGADIFIQVFNLAKFYKTNNFKPEDTVIIRSLDFNKGLFSIEYCSNKDFQNNFFEIQRVDRLFMDSLRQVLNQDICFPNVEKQLLYTYFSLQQQQWKQPGTALDLLLHNNKDIVFTPLPNGRIIFHFASQDPEDLMGYPDINILPDLDEEDFDFDTIEGILHFLNNNNNLTIVRALLYDVIVNEQKFNYTEIENYLFDSLPISNFPREIRQQLKKMITSEYKKIKKTFNRKYAFLPITTARKKILEQCLYISRFLRSLDEKSVTIHNLPKHEMMTITELDGVFEGLLEKLENIQIEGRDDASEVHRLLKIIDKASEKIPELCLTVRQKLGLR